jgi:hypothetical protein
MSLLEASTNVLYVFNMSVTMTTQGDWVQLQQSDMRLALNMAKMAKEAISHAAIEETKYLILIPRAQVRAEMKLRVEFPGHNKVKALIQRHPAMLCHNQTSGCLACQNGTTSNPQTRWRHKGTGAPPPTRRRVKIAEPTPPPPVTPPAPIGNASGSQPADIVYFPAGYMYSHTTLPCAEFFEDDEDTEHDSDFIEICRLMMLSTLSVVW